MVPVVPAPFETFPALAAHADRCLHAFLGRVPSVDVATTDRADALARLNAAHQAARRQLLLGGGGGDWPLATAQQIHGREVAVVRDVAVPAAPVSGVDGLLTDAPGIVLGIYVADCGPVFLLDPVRGAIGLVHAGRRGTERGIVPATIAAMNEHFGSRPADLLLQLGPCIRPPHYEVDFAAEILAQAHRAGVGHVHDCGRDTAADLGRYYSYRMEKGCTGRMLALLGLRPEPPPPRNVKASGQTIDRR